MARRERLPRLVRSISPELIRQQDTISHAQAGLLSTSVTKHDGVPAFVGANSTAHAGMATQSHAMQNTPGGLAPTALGPARGIRSLAAVMAQTPGLKAGGLTTSDVGLFSLSTTARRDGLVGFEHCLGSEHAGKTAASHLAPSMDGGLGAAAQPVRRGVRTAASSGQAHLAQQGSIFQLEDGFIGGPAPDPAAGAAAGGRGPAAGAAAGQRFANNAGGMGPTLVDRARGIRMLPRPLTVSASLLGVPLSSSAPGAIEMPAGVPVATCAPRSVMDTLVSSPTGLHPAGPLAPSMRSHLHAYDARCSWEGVSGTLEQLVAVRQGGVTVLRPAAPAHPVGIDTRLAATQRGTIRHTANGLTVDAHPRGTRPHAGAATASSMEATPDGVVAANAPPLRDPSPARRAAHAALQSSSLIASLGGVVPEAPLPVMSRASSGMYASTYDSRFAEGAAAPRSTSSRYGSARLLTASWDSGAGCSLRAESPLGGGGHETLRTPFASGAEWAVC